MSGAYYNENDPFAAAWLRNLIAAQVIAPGEVDERSIAAVHPGDVRSFTQCHFFAGIGVWSYALRLAGWPDQRRVWTGSAPCQPFSNIGGQGGIADERHLWPAWGRLITECGAEPVLGEQVASADGLAWLDFVCADLETAGYRVGAIDTAAAGFGAPTGRQRLYFVGDTQRARLEGHPGDGAERDQPGWFGAQPHRPAAAAGAPSHVNGFWHPAEWVRCQHDAETRWRPVEPGTFPLAPRAANHVGRLRAYGNALNAIQAAEFVAAYMAEIDGHV